jgi:uncharacterized phage protein (TIGR01671 family)
MEEEIMREIKFRVWDAGTKYMHQPALKLLHGEFNSEIPRTSGKVSNAKNWTWMQFTGLKDKNGKEIYEGDIVSLDGSITGAQGLNPGFLFTADDKVEIAWDEDIAAWSLAGKLDRTDRVEVTYRNHAIQLIQQGACEVIGNIYENPDLLQATDPQQPTKGSKRTTDLKAS